MRLLQVSGRQSSQNSEIKMSLRYISTCNADAQNVYTVECQMLVLGPLHSQQQAYIKHRNLNPDTMYRSTEISD
jgi:hypothetical protein